MLFSLLTAQLPLCYETGVRTRHNESKAGIHTDNLHFPRHNVNWGLPEPGSKPGASVPNRFYMYGVMARLAMLAASYELEATDPEAEHLGR